MRVFVLGGLGFTGQRVVRALRAVDGVEVAIGSRDGRDGTTACDILDSASRPAMHGFDAVVDCTDGRAAPPAKAAEFCLLSGIHYWSLAADPRVVEELWLAARAVPDPTGSAILGVGVFPGLSTLLAAAVAAGGPPPRRLEVGVRYSPWSQAGDGVCALMAASLAEPAVRYEEGERVQDPPLTVGGRFRFHGQEFHALGVGLPDALLAHWGPGAPSTGSLVVPRPGLPVTVQRLLALFGPWPLLRFAPTRWLVGRALWLVRGVALRWRAVPVELAAVADRGAETPRAGWLRVSDGFAAAGWMVAAAIAQTKAAPPPPGVHTIDRILRLDDTITRMRSLAGDTLHLDLTTDA